MFGTSKSSTDSQEHVEKLREFVADTFAIYMKTYGLHWNFQGPLFYSVHKLAESQYRELYEAVDRLAERVRALGRKAPLSLEEMLEFSDVKEFREVSTDETAIGELAASHRQLSEAAQKLSDLCEDQGDGFTADMVKERAGAHDKAAWMLSSLLVK
jgi:starvation-inducible DNA-binding protein